MPSSGEVLGDTVEGSENSYLDWQVASQSTSGNYTMINWQAGWRFDNYSCRGLRQGNAVINGTTVWHDFDSGDGVHTFNSGHDHRPGTGKLQCASGTLKVNHNADGTKTISMSISLVGFSAQTSNNSGSFALPTIPRNPGAPTTPVISNVTQVSADLSWDHNASDGLPNTSYTISYGLTESADTTTTTSSVTTKTITGLSPGLKYYFKVKATNSVGAGPYSAVANVTLIAGAIVIVDGVPKRAIPYVKVSGVWKVARPWVKLVGEWKEST